MPVASADRPVTPATKPSATSGSSIGSSGSIGEGATRGLVRDDVLAHPQRVVAELLGERADPRHSVGGGAHAHVRAKEPERRQSVISAQGPGVRDLEPCDRNRTVGVRRDRSAEVTRVLRGKVRVEGCLIRPSLEHEHASGRRSRPRSDIRGSPARALSPPASSRRRPAPSRAPRVAAARRPSPGSFREGSAASAIASRRPPPCRDPTRDGHGRRIARCHPARSSTPARGESARRAWPRRPPSRWHAAVFAP